MLPPDTLHRARMHSLRFRHRTRAPVRLTLRLGLQRRIDDPFRQFWLRSASSSLCHLPQAFWPLGHKALSPKSARMSVHAEFISNRQIAGPLVRQQHDAAARDYLLGGAVRTDPRLE